MKSVLAFVTILLSLNSYAGKLELVGSCVGKDSSGNDVKIELYKNSGIRSWFKKDEIVVSKGDDNKVEYDALIEFSQAFLNFDVEFEKDQLDIGGMILKDNLKGLTFKSNDDELKDTVFSCDVSWDMAKE